MHEVGISKVAIKPIPAAEALKQLQEQNQPIYLQIGSFSNKNPRKSCKNLAKQHFYEPKITSSSNKRSTLYKVQLPIDSSHNVSDLNNKLAKLGFNDTQFVTETN